MQDKTLVFFYNNLTMIMLTLNDSIALVADFENWSKKEDQEIELLKKEASKQNLKTALFVLKAREMNYGIWNADNIIKKANEIGIDQVIFYYTHLMIEQMSDEDLYKNIEGFLSIKKIMIAKNYQDLWCQRFSSDFFKRNWKDNSILLDKEFENDLEEKINLIRENKFEEFLKLTNLEYQFDARVSEGKKLGRTIGYPTINLITKEKLFLSYGVYACKVYVEHIKKTFLGAGCYWKNELDQNVFEIFLIDFDKEIYAWKVTVSLLSKLRENIKVESLEKLKEILAKDVKKTLEFKGFLKQS